MVMSSTVLAFGLSLVLSTWLSSISVTGARAQSTNASCSPDYDWAKSSEGRSPCELAALVGSTCENSPQGLLIPPLPADRPQTTYDKANSTCQCSTVYYSLISACSQCQGHPVLFWSAFTKFCPNVTVNQPGSLSVGAEIPSWAFLNVTASNTYNATRAREEAAKAPPPPTDSDGDTDVTPPPTSAAESTSTDNKGAIIGGAIGGVAFLVLTTLSIFLLLRRHRRAPERNRSKPVTLGEPRPYDRDTVYSTEVSMIKSGSTSPSPPSHSRMHSHESGFLPTLNSMGGTHGHSQHGSEMPMVSRMMGSPVSTPRGHRTADNPTGFTGAAEI